MASFMDILPYVLGGAAGLAGPNVGPALAQGVNQWRRTKRENKADVRQEKEDTRGDVRWNNYLSDRTYTEGERQYQQGRRAVVDEREDTRYGQSQLLFGQGQEDREHNLGRRDITEQRQDVVFGQGQEDRERNIGWTEESHAAARRNQNYTDAERAKAQELENQAAVGWADILNTEEGSSFANAPGMKEWLQTIPPEQRVAAYAKYQQAAQSGEGADPWQLYMRGRTIRGDRTQAKAKISELEAERAQILTTIKDPDKAVPRSADEGGYRGDDIFGDEATQTRLNQIDNELAAQMQWIEFLNMFENVSGFVGGGPRPSDNTRPLPEGLPSDAPSSETDQFTAEAIKRRADRGSKTSFTNTPAAPGTETATTYDAVLNDYGLTP
jgi:hypothetical protein